MPTVKGKIKAVRELITASQADMSKYDAQKFEEFESFLAEKIPLVSDQFEGIDTMKKLIDSLTAEQLKDANISKFSSELRNELIILEGKVGDEKFDESKSTELYFSLLDFIGRKEVFGQREKLLLAKKKEVQEKINLPIMDDLYDVF